MSGVAIFIRIIRNCAADYSAFVPMVRAITIPILRPAVAMRFDFVRFVVIASYQPENAGYRANER